MAKPEWGSKRICQSCATKYYDLGRSPIVCPKCDTVYQPVTLLKSRRNRAPVAAKSSRPVPGKPHAGSTKPVSSVSPDSKVENTAKPGPDEKGAVTKDEAKS